MKHRGDVEGALAIFDQKELQDTTLAEFVKAGRVLAHEVRFLRMDRDEWIKIASTKGEG